MIKEMDICQYLKERTDSSDDVLVDTRDGVTYKFGTICDAVNIPLDDIKNLYKLPKDKKIYVFCQSGMISGEYVQLLTDAGYDACNLTGGYRKYIKEFGLKNK